MEGVRLAVGETAPSVVVGALDLGRCPLEFLLGLRLVLVVRRLKLGGPHLLNRLLVVQYLGPFWGLVVVVLGGLYHHIHVVVVLDIAVSPVALMVVRVLDRVVVVLPFGDPLLAKLEVLVF